MSEIRATTISDTAGTGPVTLTGQYAAKAWVNFNGQGTIAARDSKNVSSLTDVGVGKFTISITSAMADTNYVVNCDCADPSTSDQAAFSGSNNLSPNYTTSSFAFGAMNFTGILQDKVYNFATTLGDLA